MRALEGTLGSYQKFLENECPSYVSITDCEIYSLELISRLSIDLTPTLSGSDIVYAVGMAAERPF